MNIVNIELKRYDDLDLFDDNRQKGIVTITYIDKHYNRKRFQTIENIAYLIPKGVYKCVFEWSPKFKSNLLEIKGVRGRSEIKFHAGAHSDHSKGCILIDKISLAEFNKFFELGKEYWISIS
jgi:hypothetical protein